MSCDNSEINTPGLVVVWAAALAVALDAHKSSNLLTANDLYMTLYPTTIQRKLKLKPHSRAFLFFSEGRTCVKTALPFRYGTLSGRFGVRSSTLS